MNSRPLSQASSNPSTPEVHFTPQAELPQTGMLQGTPLDNVQPPQRTQPAGFLSRLSGWAFRTRHQLADTFGFTTPPRISVETETQNIQEHLPEFNPTNLQERARTACNEIQTLLERINETHPRAARSLDDTIFINTAVAFEETLRQSMQSLNNCYRSHFYQRVPRLEQRERMRLDAAADLDNSIQDANNIIRFLEAMNSGDQIAEEADDSTIRTEALLTPRSNSSDG